MTDDPEPQRGRRWSRAPQPDETGVTWPDTDDVHRFGWDGVTYLGGPPESVIANYTDWVRVDPAAHPLSASSRPRPRRHQVSLEGARGDDVSWLPGLPGLLRVVATMPIKDDTPVWDVPTLTHAVLLDGCRRPARADQTPALRVLSMDGRDGLDTLAHHPALYSLQVWRTLADDLTWLQAGPGLREVHLTRRRKQPLDTGGADLATVAFLSLGCLTLTGVDGLRTGTQLREVELSSVDLSPRAAGDVLTVLAGLPHLKRVNVWRCRGLTAAETGAALGPNVEVTERY